MKLNMKLVVVHAIIHCFGSKKLAPCKNFSWLLNWLLTFKTGTWKWHLAIFLAPTFWEPEQPLDVEQNYKEKMLFFKHEKYNQTLSNDWQIYCHTLTQGYYPTLKLLLTGYKLFHVHELYQFFQNQFYSDFVPKWKQSF